jgi:hypothetical protein
MRVLGGEEEQRMGSVGEKREKRNTKPSGPMSITVDMRKKL